MAGYRAGARVPTAREAKQVQLRLTKHGGTETRSLVFSFWLMNTEALSQWACLLKVKGNSSCHYQGRGKVPVANRAPAAMEALPRLLILIFIPILIPNVIPTSVLVLGC